MNEISWNPDRPFNDLPPLAVAEELETKPVLRACIEARAALAELKQAAELIPNQSMLINTLPLMEAQASSEIENIVTTTDELFSHVHGTGDPDPAIKEALRYRQALMEGARALVERPLCTAVAESICSRIRGAEMRVRQVPGTKIVDGQTGATIYTPPEGEDLIRDLLADWERFINEPVDLDPLIRMAAAHYQFEAIHPFTDGNGRTGRILNSLFMIQAGLLNLPILYLSRYIIGKKHEYYGRLLGITRDGDWEPWLLFMLEGVRETSQWTTDKIAAIRTLADATGDHVRNAVPNLYRRDLLDLIFTQPYCRIANLVDAGIARRQTASQYLKLLADFGILDERRFGKEKIFVNRRLARLLTTESNDFEPF